MDIQKAIEERHSVRRFLDKPIEGEALERLEATIAEANRESGLHIQLVRDEPGAFTGLLAHYGRFRGVSNYLALVGRKSSELEETVGYYGERIVLEAQAAGLNTCWVGGTFNHRKARYQLDEGEKLVCLIAIGYGENQGKPHRSKDMAKCYELGSRQMPAWFAAGMEAAMLAPTALNQQNFVFMLQDGQMVSASSTGGPFSKVDLGIVKYHFEAASGHKVITQ